MWRKLCEFVSNIIFPTVSLPLTIMKTLCALGGHKHKHINTRTHTTLTYTFVKAHTMHDVWVTHDAWCVWGGIEMVLCSYMNVIWYVCCFDIPHIYMGKAICLEWFVVMPVHTDAIHSHKNQICVRRQTPNEHYISVCYIIVMETLCALGEHTHSHTLTHTLTHSHTLTLTLVKIMWEVLM